jgi:hypothetical protein
MRSELGPSVLNMYETMTRTRFLEHFCKPDQALSVLNYSVYHNPMPVSWTLGQAELRPSLSSSFLQTGLESILSNMYESMICTRFVEFFSNSNRNPVYWIFPYALPGNRETRIRQYRLSQCNFGNCQKLCLDWTYSHNPTGPSAIAYSSVLSRSKISKNTTFGNCLLFYNRLWITSFN